MELIDGGTSIDCNWDAHAHMRNYNGSRRASICRLQGCCAISNRGVCSTTRWWFGQRSSDERLACRIPQPKVAATMRRLTSSWVAGGGFEGGFVYGASDEMGD